MAPIPAATHPQCILLATQQTTCPKSRFVQVIDGLVERRDDDGNGRKLWQGNSKCLHKVARADESLLTSEAMLAHTSTTTE
jgi:hypothetical protein